MGDVVIDNIKVWSLDEVGVPKQERPNYHSFIIDDGHWVVSRPVNGEWSARFYPEDP